MNKHNISYLLAAPRGANKDYY